MVDLPPGDENSAKPKNWAQFVGEQRAVDSSSATSQLAGEVSLRGEDSPPGGSPDPDLLERQTAADMEANRLLRDQYAKRAYDLACGCITMWVILLFSQGIIKVLTDKEMWSDKVIIAVTTGVTVSVLAAFLGVIRGLFGNGALNGKDKKTKN